MNIVCPECKALIFTPSGDKEYHKKLLDGHMKAMHGDIKQKYVKVLSKFLAVFHLVYSNGGVGKDGKAFSKQDCKALIQEGQEVLNIPHTELDADSVSHGVAGETSIENLSIVADAATPDTESTKQFNNEKPGETPELRMRRLRKETKEKLDAARSLKRQQKAS